jgi:hypothetical protein
MSKSISNAAFKRMVKSASAEKRQEILERQLRVLPHFIMEEVARIPQLPKSPKVIKDLESRLKLVQMLWTEELIARHA